MTAEEKRFISAIFFKPMSPETLTPLPEVESPVEPDTVIEEQPETAPKTLEDLKESVDKLLAVVRRDIANHPDPVNPDTTWELEQSTLVRLVDLQDELDDGRLESKNVTTKDGRRAIAAILNETAREYMRVHHH